MEATERGFQGELQAFAKGLDARAQALLDHSECDGPFPFALLSREAVTDICKEKAPNMYRLLREKIIKVPNYRRHRGSSRDSHLNGKVERAVVEGIVAIAGSISDHLLRPFRKVLGLGNMGLGRTGADTDM